MRLNPRFATFANSFDAQRAITDLNGYQMGALESLDFLFNFFWWKQKQKINSSCIVKLDMESNYMCLVSKYNV